jgi:hypothetical protein
MSNQTFRRERIEGRRRNSGFAANPDNLDANTIGSEAAKGIRRDGGSVKTERQTNVSTQYGPAEITTVKGSSTSLRRKYLS